MSRIDELKEKYKDKSLTREERRRILTEIQAESYRTDTRKPVSIRRMSRINCVISLLLSLMCFSMVMIDMIGENDILNALFMIPLFGVIGYGFYWAATVASYKAEPDDELSVQNKNRSGSIAFFCTISTVYLIITIYFLISGENSVAVLRHDLYFLFASIFFLYKFYEYLIFLMIDGGLKDEPDTDEEEEE